MCVIVCQRAQRVVKINTCLFQFFYRQIVVFHLLNLRFQVVGVDAFGKTHIAQIAVVTHPVFSSIPSYLRKRRHRYQYLQVVKSAV